MLLRMSRLSRWVVEGEKEQEEGKTVGIELSTYGKKTIGSFLVPLEPMQKQTMTSVKLSLACPTQDLSREGMIITCHIVVGGDRVHPSSKSKC